MNDINQLFVVVYNFFFFEYLFTLAEKKQVKTKQKVHDEFCAICDNLEQGAFGLHKRIVIREND